MEQTPIVRCLLRFFSWLMGSCSLSLLSSLRFRKASTLRWQQWQNRMSNPTSTLQGGTARCQRTLAIFLRHSIRLGTKMLQSLQRSLTKFEAIQWHCEVIFRNTIADKTRKMRRGMSSSWAWMPRTWTSTKVSRRTEIFQLRSSLRRRLHIQTNRMKLFCTSNWVQTMDIFEQCDFPIECPLGLARWANSVWKAKPLSALSLILWESTTGDLKKKKN